NNLRKEWHLWMANGGAGETAARNLRCARLSDVCGWVKRSWEQISNEMIIQSFKTCKISNSLDEDIDDFDEIIQNSDKENEEGLEIEMCDLQARYKDITLEDDPSFEIELNHAMYGNSKFINFDENQWLGI
ncbi:19832_t:CDS:2, partial [Rhizophagus irregularis]